MTLGKKIRQIIRQISIFLATLICLGQMKYFVITFTAQEYNSKLDKN